jgi:hypothetical protein
VQVREQRFLGSGVLVKQLRSQRKGMGVEREREWDGVGEAGRARSVLEAHSNLSHGTKMLGKMLLTKKVTRKVSRPAAKFNGRLESPGWPGKDGTAQTLGQAWLL